MDLATAARLAGGRQVGTNPTFRRVVTDSRTLAAGDLFVALRGERFDGHAFVPQALRDGAVAAMVAEAMASGLAGDLLVVDDPQHALGRLARAWRERFDLPLAPRGTAFQRRVWAALVAVPYGETATYGDIAAAIDQPTATRAVGAANARNPIPLIIPCHRVVGADGALVGYSGGGGVPTKRYLLDLARGALTLDVP